MIITVIGASGFLGHHLVQHLLDTTDHTVRAFCRSAASLDFGQQWPGRLELIAGSVLEPDDLQQALRGSDVVYHLVHFMGSPDGDFYDLEAQSAHMLGQAAERCGVKRLIFMGGLGDDADKLSKHLASRHNTGRILREHSPQTIEFRASMIIGEGSVAYDIVRTIAKRLPVLMVPRWAVTKTQPIALEDALAYLTAALSLQTTSDEIVEIGGPQQLTYEDLVLLYGRKLGRREHVFAVPGVPHWLAIKWINFFMPPKHSDIAGPMVESLSNRMVVTNDSASRLFPTIHPKPITEAF
jgi:uncharacterized protein YbjT (DUF2867 family)